MGGPTADAPEPGTIRFVVGGKVHSVANPPPTRTVLDYLREELRRTGTKEGCAEGDCGACTVVLAEPADGRLQFRAVNSCIQFLPVLDGKALFTAESLKIADGHLHPVQQAMVDCHASQCGFCTPGFVMSLFALYRSVEHPARSDIDDALSGNLCRCTGYRPIVDAARRMYNYPAPPAGEEALLAQLEALRRREPLVIEHGAQRFFVPSNLAELAAMRAAHPGALLLAGGTDLGLWVTKQHQDLDQVIWVGKVPELRRIDASATHLEIGAAATLTDAFERLTGHYPELRELCRRFASPPIRNAATLGGNIANGSPIGDSMPALMALQASLVLRRGERSRELPLDRFYLDYRKNALEPGEFLERIRVPLPVAGRTLRSYKLSKRLDQDISAACAAFCLHLAEGRAADIRVAYGGMAAVPKRASHCEQALRGAAWGEKAVRAAMAALDRDFSPITDMRASAAYRLSAAKNLLYRFFLETSGAGIATRVTETGEAG